MKTDQNTTTPTSDQEIANQILQKIKELNELIIIANKKDLNVILRQNASSFQSSGISKDEITDISVNRVLHYKEVNNKLVIGLPGSSEYSG